jgi:signal transduction histidine kinase
VAASPGDSKAGDRNGFVCMEVVDDGIGIPSNKLRKIFERFYQVENHMIRRKGGLGLGLSVTKSMAELHHGKVEVESVEGKGSRFFITLPARQPKNSGNGHRPQ